MILRPSWIIRPAKKCVYMHTRTRLFGKHRSMVQYLSTTGIAMGSIPALKEGKQILLEYNRKRTREMAQRLRVLTTL